MKKLIAGLLALALILSVVSVGTVAVADGVSTMYVYTENGKNLNVRAEAKTGSLAIGSLRYGDKVGVVQVLGNGWTEIVWGSQGSAYVMSRFLVKNKPAAKAPKAAATTKDSTSVESMNALVRSARQVDPYIVSVRPTRASGWVYMRWFPSKNATSMATYPANKQLEVIAELTDWYQVVDPDTGATGYVYKSYIAQ